MPLLIDSVLNLSRWIVSNWGENSIICLAAVVENHSNLKVHPVDDDDEWLSFLLCPVRVFWSVQSNSPEERCDPRVTITVGNNRKSIHLTLTFCNTFLHTYRQTFFAVFILGPFSPPLYPSSVMMMWLATFAPLARRDHYYNTFLIPQRAHSKANLRVTHNIIYKAYLITWRMAPYLLC